MIVGLVTLAAVSFGVIVGIGLGIWGLISVKFWEHFTVEPDFTEKTDDELDLEWAIKSIKRHNRFVGIRIYTGRDPNGQWFKSLHIQVYKWYDKEIIRWNIKKGLWD